MKYNYLESIKDDVLEHIKENYTIEEQIINLDDREEWEQELNDSLWVEDSVTGNASGSYTFNRCKAKEYILDNMEILKETLDEFCVDNKTIAQNFLNEDWEYFDVSIRCYLLSSAISQALDELENYYNKILPKVEETK